MKTVPRTGQDGFTLIESLTAVTILAIALTALFQSFSGGLAAVRTTDDYTQARVIAESVLNQTIATIEQDVVREGQAGKYRWSLTLQPIDLGTTPDPEKPAAFQLYDVGVRVDWPGGRALELRTMRLAKRP